MGLDHNIQNNLFIIAIVTLYMNIIFIVTLQIN